MASKTQGKARGKGTGTVWKKGNRFYFRVRVDGTEKKATYAFFCKFPVSSTEKSDIGLLFGKPLFIEFNEHCGGDSQERLLVWEDPNVASPFFQLFVLEFNHVGSTQPFSGEVVFSHTVDREAFGDV